MAKPRLTPEDQAQLAKDKAAMTPTGQASPRPAAPAPAAAPPVGRPSLTPTGGGPQAPPPRYAQPSLTPTGGGLPAPAAPTPSLGAPAPSLGPPAPMAAASLPQFAPQPQTPAAQALGAAVMAQPQPQTQGANTSAPAPQYGPSNLPEGFQYTPQQGGTPAAQQLGQATLSQKDHETATAVQGWLTAQPPEVQQGVQQNNQEFATTIEGLITSISDLRTQLAQDDGSQAMIANWYADVEASIGQAYQAMMADMQKNMGAEDPSVKAAIGVIHEEVALQRQQMMADLDARGLSQSGILVEMNLRMSRNELSQEQQLVAGRLSEMKAAMMTAISNFAGYRANLLGQVFTARTQALQGSMDRKANLQNVLLQTQANLANTIGARDNANLAATVQRQGYTSAEGIANANNQTNITTTGMQTTAAKDVANINSITQLTVGREQNASAEGIASRNITSAENIAKWGITADTTKWQAQIASNEKLTGLQIGAAADLATASGKVSIQIAEMNGKNQLLSGQMTGAADIATNVLLPLIMSGKMTKEEVMKNLGGLAIDPNVRGVYDQILGIMPSGTVKPGAATPTTISSPVVQKGQTQIDSVTVKKLDEEIAAKEAEYEKMVNRPAPSENWRQGVSKLKQQIEALYARRSSLGGGKTPTSGGSVSPGMTPTNGPQ